MASRIRFSALAASTLTGSAEFNSLANNSVATGSVVSVSSWGQMYADWFLSASCTTTPSGGLNLYLLPFINGSPTSGCASASPPANNLVGVFAPMSATGRQLLSIPFVMMPNRDFVPVVTNALGVSLGAGSNFMYFQPYDVNPDA